MVKQGHFICALTTPTKWFLVMLEQSFIQFSFLYGEDVIVLLHGFMKDLFLYPNHGNSRKLWDISTGMRMELVKLVGLVYRTWDNAVHLAKLVDPRLWLDDKRCWAFLKTRMHHISLEGPIRGGFIGILSFSLTGAPCFLGISIGFFRKNLWIWMRPKDLDSMFL